MAFEFFFFWMMVLVCFELLSTKSAAYLLATLLVLVLTLIFFLFSIEFDILASLLFGVYSSVFIVFFLLLLHFATFWALAFKQKLNSRVYIFNFIGFSSFTLILVFGGFSGTPAPSSPMSVLWQDFFLITGITSSMTIQLLHFFFFRFFVYETLLLNFYLFFGLVLALSLLALFRLYAGPKFSAKTSNLNLKFNNLGSTMSVTQSAGIRIRQINKFRRQTRRQNSSTLKYR